MSDLTRERLAELKREAADCHDIDGYVHFGPGELEALLEMAERCVSEETVRRLARSISLNDHEQSDYDWCDFCDKAKRDLRPAAESRGAR